MPQPGEISFKDVCFQYQATRYSLEVRDLRISDGEAVSVIGKSGTGKTTLLSLILGLNAPSRGRITVGQLDPAVARRSGAFGAAFQNSVLLPWLNVYQNVALPWKLRGEPLQEARVEELLSGVGLLEYSNAFPADLSGGMQSRVALARAFSTAPEVLILDEPFANLDEYTRTRMALLISSLQRSARATLIFVTHNITEALLLSDRILLLGRPKEKGQPAGIILESRKTFRSQPAEIVNSDQFRRALAEVTSHFSELEDTP